ncbi:MAG: thiolase domain-containing protein [Calditrichaeota bacterium]|jgi:acetyl-CoA C-acetyltransferase|nr:thiolase domain-containing protein [Calditrichota bacterium]MBT7616677.1 thiolase domain-containing protein [Calditrichota bacterium]MBT7788845.1 thiolase domain-containing protein [Calditrichota bacterium]
MREVAIIGVGLHNWGELWDDSLRDMFVTAATNAINDSGVDHIDSMYIGCMSGGLFAAQEHLASLCADYLGATPIPATRVESACASGGVAMRMGWMEVASGLSDIVLVSGVEKMTDITGDEATFALSTAADTEYEGYQGVTFPGLYAMMARAHMAKYGTTIEQLSQVSVKNHANGALNPHAQYPFAVTLETVMNSTPVADPLRLLHCSPITDGAAAVILAPVELAKTKYKNHPMVVIKGSGHATDTIALHSRDDFTVIKAAEIAGKKAYEMAGKKPEDIDMAEVHDCFSIAEVMATEALGFFEPGQGGPAALRGDTALDGSMPINTSGGLKSKGHPVGATGVAQVIELTSQLRGDAGKRQLKDPKVGLAQNMGGSGGSSVVHILEKR